MSELILEPTAKAAWYRLIRDAEQRACRDLDEAKESYLVFLLMRYLRRPELVRAVLAMNFLRAANAQGRSRNEAMQEVGDQCLIFAGLFPEQASRRRVQISYFVNLGRSAYDAAAESASLGYARLYSELAEAFVPLADVLAAVRVEQEQPLFDALQAAEHWAATGSQTARSELQRFTDATPVYNPPRREQ